MPSKTKKFDPHATTALNRKVFESLADGEPHAQLDIVGATDTLWGSVTRALNTLKREGAPIECVDKGNDVEGPLWKRTDAGEKTVPAEEPRAGGWSDYKPKTAGKIEIEHYLDIYNGGGSDGVRIDFDADGDLWFTRIDEAGQAVDTPDTQPWIRADLVIDAVKAIGKYVANSIRNDRD